MSKTCVSDVVARTWLDRYKRVMSPVEYSKYIANFKKNMIVYKAAWKTPEEQPELMPYGIKVIPIEEVRLNV
jgi:hypothetical protein|tara:strand:- start:46 stop:261 length:216 start_codon:yes stop_codon:yes gene_type:complete